MIDQMHFITRETADRRDLIPLRKPHGSSLEFHILISGPGSVPVRVRVDAWCQRRAEQFAMAWAQHKWFRDQRELHIAEVDLVD